MIRLAIVLLITFAASSVRAQPVDAGSADQGAPDAAVAATPSAAAKVGAIFGEIEGISDVEISIRNGVVTLRGEVDSASLRADAERIAAEVEGVVYVQNRLTVSGISDSEVEKTTRDEKIQQQLNTIFRSVPALEDVRATVESRVVRLEGETLEPEATTRAIELAKSLDGIIYVDNRITESTEVRDRLEPAWEKTREVGRDIVRHLPLLALGLIVLLLFWFGSRTVARAIPLPQLEETPLAGDFVRQLIRWVTMIVGVFVVLEIWGVTSLVAAVMGTAGIAGIGIGFAFKDIVENYLAGILLGMRQPFSQNDFVDIDGYKGKVVRLTSRETVLMTLDGNHLTVPNALVFKGVMYNYSRNPLRRFDFAVGVNPGENFKRVLPLALETVSKTRGVCEDPEPEVLIDGFGDWTIDIHVYGWVDTREFGFFGVWSETMRRLNEAFLAAEIDMPEPMRRVTSFEGVPAGAKEVEPPSDSEEPLISLQTRDAVDGQIEKDREESGEEDLLKKK